MSSLLALPRNAKEPVATFSSLTTTSRRPVDLFDAMDRNGDGLLSRAEIGQSRKVSQLADAPFHEWDSLDQAQTKLFEYQWRIITEQMSQISSLVDGLAVLRQEVNLVKAEQTKSFNVVYKTLEQTLKVEQHASAQSNLQSLQKRIEEVESIVGDSHDKHSRALDEAHRKLADVRGSHGTLQQRLEALERCAGDAVSRHDRVSVDVEACCRRLKDLDLHLRGEGENKERMHASLHQRVLDLERAAGETHELHQRALSSSKQALQESFEKRHAVLDQRHRDLESLVRRLHEAHGQSRGDLDAAIDRLKDIQTQVGEAHSRIRGEAEQREKHTSASQHRLDLLERSLGDSADKHAKHAQNWEVVRRSHQDLDARVQELHDRHARHLQELEGIRRGHLDFDGRFSELHAHVMDERQTRDGHHATLQQRVEFLEQLLGESAEKQGRDVEASHSTLRDLFHSHLSSEREANESRHETVQRRLARLEASVREHSERSALGDDMHTLKRSLDDLAASVRHESESRESRIGVIDRRLQQVEARIGGAVGTYARELEVASSVAREQSAVRARLSRVSTELQEDAAGLSATPVGTPGPCYGRSLLSGMGSASGSRSTAATLEATFDLPSRGFRTTSRSCSVTTGGERPRSAFGSGSTTTLLPRTPPARGQAEPVAETCSWGALADRLDLRHEESVDVASNRGLSPPHPPRSMSPRSSPQATMVNAQEAQIGSAAMESKDACSWDAVVERLQVTEQSLECEASGDGEGGSLRSTPRASRRSGKDASSVVTAAKAAATAHAEAAAQLRARLEAARAETARRAEAVAAEVRARRREKSWAS